MNKHHKSSSVKLKVMDRLLIDMIETVKNNFNESPFIVLIVDDYTTKLLSSYLTMSELLKTGIFSVEPLNIKRQAFPNYQAIYFVSPTKQNLELIVNEFQDLNKPQYKCIHLYFPYRILTTVMDVLVNENIAFRIKSMIELNVAFFANDDSFSIRENNSLQLFAYNSSMYNNERKKLLSTIKNKIMTLFASMKQYPYIQYQNTVICRELAELLNGDLNELEEQNVLSKDRNTICLLIDRSNDIISPLLHDYSYKSLVYDLFDISENNVLSLPTEQIVNYKLDEEDSVWDKYKNKHMGEVLKSITNDIDEFLKSDLSKAQNKNLENFDEMIDAIKGKNEYSNKVKQLKVHLSICNRIQKIFSSNNLYDIIELEQKIVTGIDSEGNEVSNKTLFDEFSKLKLGMDELNKQRILMTLIACLDLTEDQYKMLSKDMSEESKKHIENLKNFNIHFSEKSSKKGRRQSKLSKEDFKIFKNSTSSFKYKSLRSVYPLETIVDKCSKNSLKDFPFVFEPVEFPGSKNKLNNNRLGFIDDNNDKPKIVVFVIGGMAYNEATCLENLMNNENFSHRIIIGSTSFYNAEKYILDLKNIKNNNNDIQDNSERVKLNDVKLDVM